MRRVVVDTTVQEKAITFPTDAKLYRKMCEVLVACAKDLGIKLRQSYKRKGKQVLFRQSRYAHAKQYKRSRRETRKLKIYLSRVVRDIRRKANEFDERLQHYLILADRLLAQEKHSKDKLYSIHAPEVECISNGRKLRKLTRHVRRLYKRRSAIEPMIGHLKNDNGMSKNWLKGEDGDMINALLSGCGYNMRKLMRFFFTLILKLIKKCLPKDIHYNIDQTLVYQVT